MKVLFVASGNAKKGLSPIVKAQAKSLIDLGIEIDYFLIDKKGFWGYLSRIKVLRDHLKNKDFDIIHAHYGLCGIIAYLSKTTEKLVVSFMGSDILGSVNKRGKYTFEGYLFIILNKYFVRKYDYCISKSPGINDQIHSAYKVVIPNGVNLNLFKPLNKSFCRSHLNLDPHKKYILFPANSDRYEKNYQLALKASSLIKTGAELLLVFNVDQEQLNLYYNAVDCLVLTSRYEGSPNVIKEAMACNCPIVSTNIGDVEGVLGETEGCNISSFDPSDVAEKLSLALSIGKRTNGRDRLIKLGLDSETIAKRIIHVYFQVTDNNIIPPSTK